MLETATDNPSKSKQKLMKKNTSSAIKILLLAGIFYGCQKENVTHNDYKQETDKRNDYKQETDKIETSIASGLTKDKSYINNFHKY